MSGLREPLQDERIVESRYRMSGLGETLQDKRIERYAIGN